MIFTKADKERLEFISKAAVDLRLDLGTRDLPGRQRDPSVHEKLTNLFVLLNELGAALGRIESAIKPLSKLGLETGARQTDRKVLDEILSGYNSDRILEFEDTKKALGKVAADVNRRADEALDVVRGRSETIINTLAELAKEKEDRTKWVDNQLGTLEDKLEHIEKIFVAALVRIESKVSKPKRKARRKKK
jgi:hypothetical protein